MNKILAMIISVNLCLLLSGCSQDQYAIERQYYWAKKQAEIILTNPHATPPAQLQKSIDSFNKFIIDYPKSNMAVNAQFNIAGLYMATENYEKSRAQLDNVITIYKRFPFICAQAVFLKGNVYEAQNLWDQALEQYNEIISQYPLTSTGFKTPIYIAQHYKAKFQPDEMVEAYRSAIVHYKALGIKYPGTPAGLHADLLAIECYGELKDWNSVVVGFNAILKDYKGKARMDEVLINLAVVYAHELNDKLKAVAALKELIREYPTSKFVPTAQAFLKEDRAK